MRLINANELGHELKISPNGYLYVTDNDIINAPTIDAVPVVRCKDCIHARKLKDSVCVWKCSRNYLNIHAVDGNDFCSYGKRKEA